MKVLFLIESLAGGGAEKVLATLVQNIDKAKFDVTVCAISGGGKYENEVKRFCKYKALLGVPSSPLFRLLYLIKHHLIYKWMSPHFVYKLFLPHDNDVEVAFTEGFATKLLSASPNKRKIAWVHIDLRNNHWTRSVYKNDVQEKRTYSRFSDVVCVSDTARDGFFHEFEEMSVPVETIYNPVDASLIRSMACGNGSLTRDYTSRDYTLCVTAGRLEKQKGYDRLIRIIKRVVDEKCAIKLWILGDGTQESELRKYVEKNGLSGVVDFKGFCSNPYEYISQGDLFVCSSRSEGYSTAVTEALILGLPVITTECSGMRELLKDGECGVITDNNEDALYAGLKRLLDDKSMLMHYKTKAVERGDDFSMAKLMEPIENLLKTIAKQ